MELSLVEIKEKLKPQLKSLLDVDTFKIVAAERKEKFWVLVIQIPGNPEWTRRSSSFSSNQDNRIKCRT
ncbi:hypothetical protein [Ferroplasma acidarmanus]|uniref:Uncharacterized protein n=1 Tax=Ferroplasma acidarmanus Fer1 TaxID=333146 RepID=S0ASX8_FERAC|nr:hypothetical protein [Ferroplasma acidarmanus]AGO61907.1 hypothetical protein FACI_IFERC00001G1931 [Ferroplasma acidarmanus Fer1]